MTYSDNMVIAPYFDLNKVKDFLSRNYCGVKFEFFTDTFFDESEEQIRKLKYCKNLVYVLTPECVYSSDYRIMLMITQPYIDEVSCWFLPVGNVQISDASWDNLDFIRKFPVGFPQ